MSDFVSSLIVDAGDVEVTHLDEQCVGSQVFERQLELLDAVTDRDLDGDGRL